MLKENQILVIIKEPSKEPYIEPLFTNELKAFQEAVGGYIETVTLDEDTVAIVNEEGIPLGLPENMLFRGFLLFGTIVIAGYKEDEFCSVKGAKVSRLMNELKEGRK